MAKAKEEKLTMETALATINGATRAIVKITSIEEAKQAKDEMAAIKYLLKKCKASHLHLHKAACLKIWSERELGEWISKEIQNGGDRRSVSHQDRLKLDDIGIDYNESSRCQRIASIPELELEAFFETNRAEGIEVTTAGVMRLWKALNSEAEEPTEKPFLPSQEQEAILSWLTKRREGWPAQFQPTFTGFVKRLLDHLENPGANDGREGADSPDAEAGAA